MSTEVLLIDRNLIKFNLTSRTRSLQPPGIFASAVDVVGPYSVELEGKGDATLYCPCTASDAKP